jgi:hypothetical protein
VLKLFRLQLLLGKRTVLVYRHLPQAESLFRLKPVHSLLKRQDKISTSSTSSLALRCLQGVGSAITEIRALDRATKETLTLNGVFCHHRLQLRQYGWYSKHHFLHPLFSPYKLSLKNRGSNLFRNFGSCLPDCVVVSPKQPKYEFWWPSGFCIL